MIQLAHRITSLNEPQTLAMAQKSRDLQAQGIDVINLSIGEPDFKTPIHIQEAAKAAIDSQNYFGYSPVSGFADVKAAVCHKLQHDNNLIYTPDQIVVSTGAKQALINAVLSIVQPGDEVILPTPFWVSYELMVQMAEGVPVRVQGKLENEYKITPQQLEAAITPKTRAFIFSSPCNPTGAVYSKEELAVFADIFAKHPNIVIISDEIYEFINYVGGHASIASHENLKDRVVVINGLSKGFAMTGWRLGFLAAPKELAKACEKMQSQYTSGTCSISQRAAITALTGTREPSWMMRDAFKVRRDMVIGGLKAMDGIKINNPEGAFYAFPDISSFFGKSAGSRIINNATDMAMYLIEEGHVATVTGEAFGDDNAIRLSFAASDEKLKIALERIGNALSALK